MTLKAWHILIVHESHAGAERIVLALKRAGYRPAWKRVDTAGTFTAAIGEPAWVWDAIICDWMMPKLRSRSALQIARALVPKTPFIVVSDEIGQTHASGLLRDGACGLVRKDRLEDLAAMIARAVGHRAMPW